jgi:hypothetical protein
MMSWRIQESGVRNQESGIGSASAAGGGALERRVAFSLIRARWGSGGRSWNAISLLLPATENTVAI